MVENEKKIITLTGIAGNSKAGACFKVGDIVYYIDGMDSWQDNMLDKEIVVSGNIVTKRIFPDVKIDENGGISQGMRGEALVIENAKWKQVK
ncbi:MAG: hypothetical protein ACTSVE_09035 [Candidatus Helarchaeota archaeon]